MTQRVRQSLSVFFLVLVAVSSPALARPVAPPVKRYVLPAFGVSFAVPASWEAHDYRDRGFPQLFGGSFGPETKFAAVVPKSEQGFQTNFTVSIVPATSKTIFDHARASIGPFRLDPAATIVGSPSDLIRLPGGQAWRIKVRFAGAANGGGTVTLLQYHFLRNGHVYVFSFATLQTLESKHASTFDDSARSIRFTMARAASPQTLYTTLLKTPLTRSQLPAGFHSATVRAKANGPIQSRHRAVGEVEVILDSGEAGIVYVIFPTRADALGNHADGVKSLATLKGMTVRLSAPGVPKPSLIVNGSVNGSGVTQVSFVAGNVEINALTFSSSSKGRDGTATLRLARFALQHINALK